MNKTIKAIVVTCVVLLMAGCEVGEGELMKTKKGHLMYLGWTDNITEILANLVEPAFNLNAWLEAPDDQKPEILRKHFYDNTEIEVLSNHAWRIRSESMETTLRMSLQNGNSLAETGAKMRLLYVGYRGEDVLNNIIFVLENKGNGVWELYSEDGNIKFRFTLGTQGMPESIIETSLTIEGEGTFTQKTIISHCSGDVCTEETYLTFLSYTIQQPFEGTLVSERGHYYLYGFSSSIGSLAFSSGKVHLQALDEEGQGNTADITVLNPEEIEIEMDGIVQRRKL